MKILRDFQSVFTSLIEASPISKDVRKTQGGRERNMDTIMKISCCTWHSLQRELVETTATAFLSTLLVGSFTYCKHSPNSGFQIII